MFITREREGNKRESHVERFVWIGYTSNSEKVNGTNVWIAMEHNKYTSKRSKYDIARELFELKAKSKYSYGSCAATITEKKSRQLYERDDNHDKR